MRRIVIAIFATLVLVVLRSSVGAHGAAGSAQGPGSADCVTIGRPKPTETYVYQHTEPGGRATRVTNAWDRVTETGSRLRADGPAGVFVQVNAHHVENDVLVLDQSSKLGPGGNPLDSTTFHPGLIAEPAFRACAGQSWQIPSVTAAFKSDQTNSSVQTPAGSLKIVAVHERVTVPAGTFDTVHYIRTSQSTDEYWKSIEHGVVVKHTATLPVGTVSEVLLEIR
jgi:hypothetical protein